MILAVIFVVLLLAIMTHKPTRNGSRRENSIGNVIGLCVWLLVLVYVLSR
jgi:hypothetical protein